LTATNCDDELSSNPHPPTPPFPHSPNTPPTLPQHQALNAHLKPSPSKVSKSKASKAPLSILDKLNDKIAKLGINSWTKPRKGSFDVVSGHGREEIEAGSSNEVRRRKIKSRRLHCDLSFYPPPPPPSGKPKIFRLRSPSLLLPAPLPFPPPHPNLQPRLPLRPPRLPLNLHPRVYILPPPRTLPLPSRTGVH
jgi:hypothetical protein